MKSFRWMGAALLLAGVLQAACSSAGELRVPLVMRETEGARVAALSGGESPLGSIKVFVDARPDERPDSLTIGQNLEDENPVPVYWQTTAPTEFVRAALERELGYLGVQVSGSAAEATRLITFRLTRFYVTERQSYEADVGAVITVASASGQTLWEAPMRAQAKRFGRSLSRENYQEVLSDATVRMVAAFLNNDAARKALTQ